MKFSNSKGITLVSIIITIIVMLILTGVVISNIVGDDNAIEKAKYSKEESEDRSDKEALQQYINKYNSNSYVGIENFEDFLKKELGLTENDYKVPVALSGIKYYEIMYLGKKYYIREQNELIEIVENVPEDVEEKLKKIQVGDKIITPTTEIEADTSYAILETADLKDYSYDIPANSTVTLRLLSDMKITNANLENPRAAINLNENSVLNLQIESNVEVNSTFGQDAEITKAGAGGYAGIHVPPSATLNLSGEGTLTCYGGDAGDGGTMYDASITGNDKKCAGGGGAGAGISGNGGCGGAYVAGKGANGGNGEACGTVNITGTVTVYAYGGAGGSGGAGTKTTATAGGGGGYPAAGIGGGGAGGAGGTCCAGAGGYTGGTGEQDTAQSHNGLAGGRGPTQYTAPNDAKIGRFRIFSRSIWN